MSICRPKLEKLLFLDQNHGLTTLEKCRFLDFWNFFFLQPRKAFLEKWPFLDQNHGLTPLKKCQFFDCLKFLFLQPRKATFRSRISYKKLSQPLFPKKKMLEKWPFLDQNYGLTRLEKCQLYDFLNFFVFIALKGNFHSRIT